MTTKLIPLLVLLAIAGCSSVPPTLEQRGVERLAQLPPESRKKIDVSLSRYFSAMTAPEVNEYLSRVAKRLVRLDPDASASDPRVS